MTQKAPETSHTPQSDKADDSQTPRLHSEDAMDALDASLEKSPYLRRRNNQPSSVSLSGLQYANKHDVDTAIKAIKHNPHLVSIDLRDVNMNPAWMAKLLKAAATCPNLESVELSGNDLHGAALPQLLQALPQWPRLQSFLADNSKLDKQAAMELCHALTGLPHLNTVSLNNNALDGAAAASLLAGTPALRRVSLQGGLLEDAELPLLAEAFSHHDSVAVCSLHYNNFSDEAVEKFAARLKSVPLRNMVQTPLHHDGFEEHCNRNFNVTTRLLDTLQDTKADALSVTTLAAIEARLPAMDRFPFRRPDIDAVRARLDSLPQVNPEAVTVETLTRPDAQGHTPLDNPRTWQQFGAIAERLAHNGTPVTRDMLMQPNRDGQPSLMAALANRPEKIIPALTAAGIQLDASVLLDGSATPSPLLQQLIDDGTAPLLFTRENWKGHAASDIAAAYRQLPPEQQEAVSGYHALLTQTRPAPQRGAGR